MLFVRLILLWVWVSPATVIGLAVGLASLLFGGRVQRIGRTLEFWGGPGGWLLRRGLPIPAAAMTLGHVILGRSRDDLTAARAHEWVHVRQYERWGPLFIPVYLGLCGWQWIRGRHPYWDHPFERAAYREAP